MDFIWSLIVRGLNLKVIKFNLRFKLISKLNSKTLINTNY
jgi:hypothetical protein